jgi:branched-chain amino acid transport system ATP-binding protein
MALASDAQVLLLDEPTAGMSRSETARFVPLLRELTEGKTLLMVEHDMGVVFELADRIAVLVQGELLACDTPQAIRANPAVQRAYLGQAHGGDA